MKLRKIILFLLLIIGLFGTVISEAFALELDELILRTPREGSLLRSTKVPVNIVARAAVECEYTVTNEDTGGFVSDALEFPAPEREGKKTVNRLSIDIEGILGDPVITERETRRGTISISSIPEQEYTLEIECTPDGGDTVFEEISFSVKPRGTARVVRED